ncbi:MAG: L-histidine N(alpha)-methyltransferase [Alphaproteobacteria bacterium]|nr:L-histidine N(alpha)-methyltransferase [Alphaproteobacteria bacterium]
MPDGSPVPRAEVAADALEGLLSRPKTLPPKLFYDAEGCRLFSLITGLPEYYLTRTELLLLDRAGPAIGARVAEHAAVVEYGAGSETKATILLAALRQPAAYVPIDIAEPELKEGAARLARAFPGLTIHPTAADFSAPFRLPAAVAHLPRLGFFPGSTIGNFDPATAIRFLAQARQTLGDGAQFLLGADLRKDPALLIPAYDDAQGITAAFNRNILARLNREAAADFKLQAFAHRIVWNDAESRIEMHLVSRVRQTVHVAGRAIHFAEGESIHTENSYKYTPERLLDLARQAGWQRVQLWTDPDDLFSIQLLKAESA